MCARTAINQAAIVMSIERMVIGNFRRAQAFNRSLTEAAGLEKIVAEFISRVMFEPNTAKRTTAIGQLEASLMDHAINEVLPQAERIGEANAKDIISKTPKPEPVNLLDADARKRALAEGRARATERIRQIQLSIRGEANNLDTRLTKYWLEPAEGTEKVKLDRLQEIHKRLEARRKGYESDLRKYQAGEIKKRPSRPNLDYASELTQTVKDDVRSQARRTGTDKEITTFKVKGYGRLAWVVPNGEIACPDCQLRVAVVLTPDEWEREGRPGSGRTVCGDHCYCMLVPAETVKNTPGLIFRIRSGQVKPVLTTADQIAFFNAHRFNPRA
jgi:hypothetical protein